jgi:hypothetical protein
MEIIIKFFRKAKYFRQFNIVFSLTKITLRKVKISFWWGELQKERAYMPENQCGNVLKQHFTGRNDEYTKNFCLSVATQS